VRSAAELFEELCALDESATIEAKRGTRIDRSILETICAFTNEPRLGGGDLLLGVSEAENPGAQPRFSVVGVDAPERVQAELITQCATAFNRPLRPRVRAELLEGRVVVVVRVDEAPAADKPVFLKTLGLPRGAFRRFGPTDHEGTDDDLVALVEQRAGDSYDGSVVRDAELTDIDPEAVRAYRTLRARAVPDAEELGWSDEDLLRALHAAASVDGQLRPTVAGLLLFGRSAALRRCFPMTRVDCLRLPGRRWVEDPERAFDAVEIRAPLLLAIPRAVAAVMDDLPTTFALPPGELVRQDETLLPMRVVREAIVNALMHRSYRTHAPVQILRYQNRLEIRNPGHSLKSPDLLGEPGSECRNPRIAAVLHDVRLAESKGSGIRVMRDLMRQHRLELPAFESAVHGDRFVATFLFHHFLDAGDLAWLRTLTTEPLSDEDARVLIFVREVGAIDNGVFRGFGSSDMAAAAARLRRLRDLGLLEMKGTGRRTYYVAGPALVRANTPDADPSQAAADRHQLGADPHQLGADPHQLGADPHQLPPDLASRIAAAGARPRRPTLRALVRDLCAWRALSSRELAQHLGARDPKILLREHLTPMIDAGELAYTIPKMPNHPEQKYMLPKAEDA
jgi:ATP-dependent DNA helicase RecG